MKELWVEKYRPRTVADYVFRDEDQRRQVQSWIDAGGIPHLLFSGAPGVGKTTLAKILISALGVDDFDVMEINASRDGRVEDMRERISGFVQTMPFGDFKVVLLDEADFISPHGQATLRGMMETYHASARFILTCNYPTKVIPALHSRCQGFHIERVDATEFTARVATVLVTEGVEFDLDTLDTYVKAAYPDLRKCLNTCQMNSTLGRLESPHGDEGGVKEWKLEAVDLFKQGRVTDARRLMCSSVRADEMEEVFRWMYDNLELWSTDPEQQDQAIVIIRNGLVNVPMVADQEINLAATMIELSHLKNA
jgi:DNA polymerase III delta prime subunit